MEWVMLVPPILSAFVFLLSLLLFRKYVLRGQPGPCGPMGCVGRDGGGARVDYKVSDDPAVGRYRLLSDAGETFEVCGTYRQTKRVDGVTVNFEYIGENRKRPIIEINWMDEDGDFHKDTTYYARPSREFYEGGQGAFVVECPHYRLYWIFAWRVSFIDESPEDTTV